MEEDKLIGGGPERHLAKEMRRNISIRSVISFALLQALFCCTILPKSVALPRVFPGTDQSALPLTLTQNNEARLIVRDVSTTDSGPLDLDLSVNLDKISGYAFLMFRGVPENFNFTSGFRVKRSWVVSLRDLAELQLAPPEGYIGQFELTVLLVRERNETVESHKMLVSFGQSESPVVADAPPQNEVPQQNEDELLTSAIPTATPEENTAASPSLIAQEELGLQIPTELQVTSDQEQKLMKRAADLVEIGEISSARLMFEHLAKKGSGLGAMALAQTYDPTYFRAMKTLGGVSADLEKARMWYQIAADLGQQEAQTRLSALASN